MLNIFVLDSQPLVVEGIRLLLVSRPDEFAFGQAFSSADEACAYLQSGNLGGVLVIEDVFNLDQIVQAASSSGSTMKILLRCFTANSDMVLKLLRRGVSVILKDSTLEEFWKCLSKLMTGEVWIGDYTNKPVQSGSVKFDVLTSKEREVCYWVHQRKKNEEIALELRISPGTVKVHLMHIFKKVGVKDRKELRIFWEKHLGTSEEAPAEVPAEA